MSSPRAGWVHTFVAFATVAGCGGGTSAVDAGGDAWLDATDSGADLAQDLAVDLAPELECFGPSGEAALVPETEGVPAEGLVLWLRGDRGVHKSVADTVCGWADQSGKGWLFTADAGRPTWLPTGLGGRAAIRSTATGDGLRIAGVLGIAPQSARTIVAVTRLASLDKPFTPFFSGQELTFGVYLAVYANTFNTMGQREGVFVTNNAYDSDLPTSLSPRVHVFVIQTMTVGTPVLSGISYRVDGTPRKLSKTPGVLGYGDFESFEGADHSGVGLGPEGMVAEVLVYDRAVTLAESKTIEAALKTRYGIQ